jgi:hypothetical protein
MFALFARRERGILSGSFLKRGCALGPNGDRARQSEETFID